MMCSVNTNLISGLRVVKMLLDSMRLSANDGELFLSHCWRVFCFVPLLSGVQDTDLSVLSQTMTQCCKEIKETVQMLASRHKDIHGSVSKVGKAIDRVSRSSITSSLFSFNNVPFWLFLLMVFLLSYYVVIHSCFSVLFIAISFCLFVFLSVYSVFLCIKTCTFWSSVLWSENECRLVACSLTLVCVVFSAV